VDGFDRYVDVGRVRRMDWGRVVDWGVREESIDILL
jgi:hypothetical protein